MTIAQPIKRKIRIKGRFTRQRVYSFIEQFKLDHGGNSPTFRQIRDAADIKSTSTVRYILESLESQGLIDLPSDIARGIKLPGEQYIPPVGVVVK